MKNYKKPVARNTIRPLCKKIAIMQCIQPINPGANTHTVGVEFNITDKISFFYIEWRQIGNNTQ